MSAYKDFAQNRSYYDVPLTFGKPRPEQIGGTRANPVLADTGAFLADNGDIRFKLFEPEAQHISIEFTCGHNKKTLELEKDGEGFFMGIFPNTGDVAWRGKRIFTVNIDGVSFAYPRMPIVYRTNRPVNYVDIPDVSWDEYLIKDVPHGAVTYNIYWSDTVKDWQRCLVYTPPGYNHDTERQYPVLYLHHGMTENETTWMFMGKVPQIMDNLIASGEAEPFIVVTNENCAKLPSDGSYGMEGFSSVLIDDCIPFIEKEYRAIPDKWHRGTAGNSYGAMLSSRLGFGHPELFSYIGLLSGGLRCRDCWPRWEQNDHLTWLYNNAEEVGRAYSLIYRAHGTAEFEDFRQANVEEDEFLKENGIAALPCFVREFFEGGYHEWDNFGKEFAGFARNAFKKKTETL
ncbi:MAG: hypothetical protein LUD82_08400 [Clostridiales bacterium]|nr:hypothetical protein [Clostridiales bacterium]